MLQCSSLSVPFQKFFTNNILELNNERDKDKKNDADTNHNSYVVCGFDSCHRVTGKSGFDVKLPNNLFTCLTIQSRNQIDMTKI